MDQLKNTLKVQSFYKISLISIAVLGIFIGFLIFQLFYNNYYNTTISIFIINISYGTATAFIIRLSLLFFSWYKSNHNMIVFLYFISMFVIGFNLIMTSAYTIAKVTELPSTNGEYVGSSGSFSSDKYLTLETAYRISSIMSFFSIWITTAILMNYYRERLTNAIVYWILISIPLFYFLITYFYQFIFGNLLISYVGIDPVTISIILGIFLSLNKPIGGLVFGAAFGKTSKIVSYEINIRTYMIMSQSIGIKTPDPYLISLKVNPNFLGTSSKASFHLSSFSPLQVLANSQNLSPNTPLRFFTSSVSTL